jgi:DNA-binding response OmpR family regulator
MSAPAWTVLSPQLERLHIPPAPVRLLTVGLGEPDHGQLRRYLQEPECKLYRSKARRDALPMVRSRHPNVLMCEQNLSDGTWQDLLGDLQSLSRPPMLIVCSLLADDRLWAEVLNIGGYDVLMKPFQPMEVARVVRMAARQGAWMRSHG